MKDDNRVDEFLRRNPQLRRHLTDYGSTWMLEGGVLNIFGNISGAEAKRIAAHTQVELMQFARKFQVSVDTLRALDQHVLAKHRTCSLRLTLNGLGAFDDLAFIEHL